MCIDNRLGSSMAASTKSNQTPPWGKRPDISLASLSSTEMLNLCKPLEVFGHIASHDGREPVRIINSYVQIFNMKINELLACPTAERGADVLHFIREIKEYGDAMKESVMRLNSLFEHIIGGLPDSNGRRFVVSPYQLFDHIAKERQKPSIEISVSEASSKNIWIIFQAGLFWFAVSELVRNSAFAAGCSKVFISWDISDRHFIFNIEDDGCGIIDHFDGVFLAKNIVAKKDKKGGLSIASDIVSGSGGLMLMKRSERLGGTHVIITLPIIGYFLNEKFYDLR